MFIRTENLTYTYMPGTPFAAPALKGVNISIPRGSLTAIIGPSGSGKSTLIQHFNGLLRPTAGKVYIDGRPVGQDRAELLSLRRRVGLVFQMPEAQFFAETVFDELAFAPRNLGLPPQLVEERVDRAARLVGLRLEECRRRSPFRLSAGQKRLVAVASLITLAPEALILDEPTAGLDPAVGRNLLQLLAKLNREEGLTVCLVSHSLEEVAPLAEKIFVLSSGRLVMEGTPAEIFSRGARLRELGLQPPALSEIMNTLADRGAPVQAAVFSLEEACRQIVAWKEGEKG